MLDVNSVQRCDKTVGGSWGECGQGHLKHCRTGRQPVRFRQMTTQLLHLAKLAALQAQLAYSKSKKLSYTETLNASDIQPLGKPDT
jgi:hypothetical protein